MVHRKRADSGLNGFLQSLLGVAIAFLLVVGGMALAVWAIDNDQETLGLVSLVVAGCAFAWLWVLHLAYGASLFGGDEPSVAPLIILSLLVFGGMAVAFMGFGLLMLGFVAAPIILVWGLISAGGSLFD